MPEKRQSLKSDFCALHFVAYDATKCSHHYHIAASTFDAGTSDQKMDRGLLKAVLAIGLALLLSLQFPICGRLSCSDDPSG